MAPVSLHVHKYVVRHVGICDCKKKSELRVATNGITYTSYLTTIHPTLLELNYTDRHVISPHLVHIVHGWSCDDRILVRSEQTLTFNAAATYSDALHSKTVLDPTLNNTTVTTTPQLNASTTSACW